LTPNKQTFLGRQTFVTKGVSLAFCLDGPTMVIEPDVCDGKTEDERPYHAEYEF
jgi:hypothetical protein